MIKNNLWKTLNSSTRTCKTIKRPQKGQKGHKGQMKTMLPKLTLLQSNLLQKLEYW